MPGGTAPPGSEIVVSWFSLFAAAIMTAIDALIISRPKAIFVGMEGCQPRRSRATHIQADRGAMRKMARALIDWNHAVGIGLKASAQLRSGLSAVRGFSLNMTRKRSSKLTSGGGAAGPAPS